MKKFSYVSIHLCVVISLVFFPLISSAKPTPPSSTVSGNVTVQGTLGSSPKATVKIKCLGSNYSKSKKVDNNFKFSFTGMPIGRICTITVKNPLPKGCQSVSPASYSFFNEGSNWKNRNFKLTCNAQCSDKIDNDGDGKIDFPNDPGCKNPGDNNENQKPVITLIDNNPIILRVDRNYVEPGATVNDPEEGDITNKLVITGVVDTSTVGTYKVFYNAKDSHNAKASTVKRIVKVVPPKYGPYCGDGIVNQSWEKCDSGNNKTIVGCSAQCQYVVPDCHEHVFMKTTISKVQNKKMYADASTDIYIGGRIIPSGVWEVVMYDGVSVLDSSIEGYENIPDVGITMQRTATGTITTRHFGSHKNDGTQEHLEGTIEFYGSAATNVGNDTSGNNKMENWGPNMVAQKAINAGKDAAWIDSEISNFWTTVTVADDSFFTYWNPIPVCEDPNQPPVADAGVNQSVLTGTTVLFDGTNSYDVDGTIVSYDWDFGDSSTSTGSTTSHVYSAVGNYTVTLTVKDDDGAVDASTTTIVVREPASTYGVCINKFYTDTDNSISAWPVGIAVKNNCDDGEEWADHVVEYFPRGDIAINRKDENKAIGATDGADEMNFVSLGKGDGGPHGEIILKFDNLIIDGTGNDLEVIEATWGNKTCDEYTEKAEVFVSQDYSNWVSLGIICQDGSLDLDGSGLDWARYVKIVDVTTDSRSSDGYDVDAVRSLHCEDYTTVSEGFTGCDGQYCVSGLSSSTQYYVYEKMLPGWENNLVVLNGNVVSGQSNSFFDVYTTFSFGQESGTTTVDFYNREEYIPPVYECSDGIDNDDPEDSLVDADDPGCWTDPTDSSTYDPTDNNETYTPPTFEPYCGDGNCDEDECCLSCPQDCGECYVPPEEPEEPKKKGGNTMPKLKILEVMEDVVGDDAVAHFKYRTNMKGSTLVVCDSKQHLSMGQYADDEGSPLYYGYPYHTIETDRQFPEGGGGDERTIIHEVTLELGLGIDTYYCRVISGDNYTGTIDGHVKKEVIIHVPVKTYSFVEEPEDSNPIIPDGIVEQRCELLLTDWILPVDDSSWEGHTNDSQEFQDLKNFFNFDLKGKYGTFLEDFTADNYYVGSPMYNAVVKFQEDEASYVLEPWYLKHGTGNVYISTINRVNEIHCNIDIPFSDAEWKVIKKTREGKKNPYKDKTIKDIPPVAILKE